MINVEGEVTRYIRIPEDLAIAVTERLNTEKHLFRAGHGWDDLVIPYLQAYVAQEDPGSAQARIDQALARVRKGRLDPGKLEA